MMTASRLPIARLPNLSAIFIVLGALLLAAFAGLLTSYLPWLYTVLFFLSPLVLAVSIANPQLGLVVMLMFIFEVVPSAFQPRLPFGGGTFEAFDLLLIYLGAIVLVRALATGRRPLLAMGALRWPLYYLLVCMVVSLVYVRYFAPNPLMLAESRSAIAWLVVPLIALSADTPVRYRWMVRCVLVMAALIALYVTIQTAFGVRIMTAARVEALDSGENSDVVRSIAGGGIYVVVFALLLIINRISERRAAWWWALPCVLLLVAGLAVQFGRGVWIATGIGLLLSAYLFRGASGVVRIALVGLVAVAVVLAAAAAFKPRIAEALVERATGIGNEIESGGSFGYRKLENQYALDRIERSPLTGAGLGGDYKKTSGHMGAFIFQTTYIHNGYLFFPLKMGVLATFIPLAFIVAFIVTVRQGQARNTGTAADKAFLAALCGAFVVPVITSYTQPEWSNPQGIASYAIFMGLALLYRQMGSPLPAPAAST